MELYLIRHTRPLVEKGVCYGQADLDLAASFEEEARQIRMAIPASVQFVYSSPLQRCSRLARYLFPEHTIRHDDRLMEINCGAWELRKWDEIDPDETDLWMSDLIHSRIPGGETYHELALRVMQAFEEISRHHEPAAIVAHGGVLRSILASITQTELIHSFDAFRFHYGSVIRLFRNGDAIQYHVLQNIPHEAETHKPRRN